jgi:DNA-binding transcriptional ArsR family regulator
MLETRPLIANVSLETHEFRKALPALREQGWIPAILQAEHEFLRLAGVDETLALRTKEAGQAASSPGRPSFGELFFRGGDIYYCVCAGAATQGGPEPSGRRHALEVGLISKKPADADKRARTFAAAVEMAVRKAVESQKAQEMMFDWAPPKPDRSRLAALEQPGAQSDARFAAPKLDRELVRGAAILAEPLAREILAELTLAGFSRTRDVLAARQSKPDAAELALDKLRRAGLVTLEHLLECKKYGTPLTRLADPAKLQTPEVGALVCPSCSGHFLEESLCDGFSVSDLGKRLSRNAHWLTVLIMYKLAELGVPLESMLHNVSRSGEDVDIAVQFLGRFWTFELKDGEFAAADVVGFNHRRARHRPQKAFVVSTAKVAPDAARLLEELSAGDPPTCLEGLTKAGEALRTEVHAASLGYACGRLRVVEDLTSYDVARVVEARFEEKARGGEPAAEPAAPAEPPDIEEPEDRAAQRRSRPVPQKQ